MGAESYRQYEADKLLVSADPTLTGVEKDALITELTDQLLEAEQAEGIRHQPLFRLRVEAATDDGSQTIDMREAS